MIRAILVSVAFAGLSACAASGTQPPGDSARPQSPVANNFPLPIDGESGLIGKPKVGQTTIVAAGNARQCRKEKVTGSRIPKTICMTDAERQHMQNAAQEGMRAIRRSESAAPRE